MKKRVLLAALVIGALFCCGIVSAEKPAEDPVQHATFVHYQDGTTDIIKEKTPPTRSDVDQARAKNPKAAGTPTPKPTATATPTPTDTTTPSPTPTPAESDQYSLKPTKWTRYPVTFYVNSDASGLSEASVAQEVIAAFTTWDNEVALDLTAYGGATALDGIRGNHHNDVYWAPVSDSRIIAATAVSWNSTGITEADIQMNSALPWGIDADGEGTQYSLPGRYDVRNLATHEIGHLLGLNDLYDASASSLTMYGIGGMGEVKSISLGYGDILGIRALYGA